MKKSQRPSTKLQILEYCWPHWKCPAALHDPCPRGFAITKTIVAAITLEQVEETSPAFTLVTNPYKPMLPSPQSENVQNENL